MRQNYELLVRIVRILDSIIFEIRIHRGHNTRGNLNVENEGVTS